MNIRKTITTLCVVLCLMLVFVPSILSVEAQAEEAQTITINMHDSYGDGWGNNAINILENGVLMDTATFSQGKEGTWSYTMDPGKNYAFVWVKGAWSSECFFEILINGETVFTATTTDCNLFLDGTVLYPPCEHLELNAVVTAPSCTEDGYTTYTCTTCGEKFVDDETSATGHEYGDDDFCDVCGYDKNSVPVTITMADSFGDGWNGNAILVYEDGELIATVTLTSGNRNGTWSYFMDSRKSYEFFWKKGNFANECSFTISVGEEVVLTATQSNCSGFKNNHVLYPPCTHTDCDAVVTPPTCTKYGFTTYTCKKCGHTSIGNIEYALGHSFGHDTVCDTCGYDTNGITINMADTYGDGWNNNAIEIYADGELVGTARLASGNEGVFYLAVDQSKEYTFHWVKGSTTYECSFEILIAGESKLVVTSSECEKYISGQQIYPQVTYSGWTEFGNKVYYFDPVTNKPVKGVNRVPYPGKPLNGITYAPNPADLERYGESFIDKDEAWFFFDSYSGELKQTTTGIWSVQVVDTYEYRYVVNGMLPWHVGLVQEMGYYWYFMGDSIYGGNVVSYGDVCVSRNNTDFDMVVGGVYTFDWYGHMCKYDGITNVNGVLRYYKDYRLMKCYGLTKVGERYIYVRSNGELAIGEYYITNVDNDESGLFVTGQKLFFDENGFTDAPKQGIQEVDGELYYFVNNHIQYNSGLIEVNGGWIYVRANGKLAVGKYWVTNTNGAMEADYYEFDENGYMIVSDAKEGIVAEGEKLYFYQDGLKKFGLGLVELEEGSYVYVRTNGELAVGSYWITNHNDLLDEGIYEFAADGILTVN